MRLPAPEWLLDYRKAWLAADIIAGLTAAAVVIPKALAYATVAGLPVQVGLYTALVPMLIYALLGTSRPLSVSTTTTIAILTGVALGQAVPSGDAGELIRATAALTFLVGAILILAALLRLGFVANFISEPVLVGFKAGIGLVIVLDQIPKLLGIHIQKGSFGHNLLAIIEGMPQASGPTVAVGIFTVALLLAIERWFPRWPAPLVAVAVGIAAVGRVRPGRQPWRGDDRLRSDRATRRDDAGLATADFAVARSHGHRAHELHRVDRGRPRIRPQR